MRCVAAQLFLDVDAKFVSSGGSNMVRGLRDLLTGSNQGAYLPNRSSTIVSMKICINIPFIFLEIDYQLRDNERLFDHKNNPLIANV
jgi:hypothetical protein